MASLRKRWLRFTRERMLQSKAPNTTATSQPTQGEGPVSGFGTTGRTAGSRSESVERRALKEASMDFIQWWLGTELGPRGPGEEVVAPAPWPTKSARQNASIQSLRGHPFEALYSLEFLILWK